MNKYTEAAVAYDKAGGGASLVPRTIQMEEGQMIIGKLTEQKVVNPKGIGRKPFVKYTFDTDEGVISIIPGDGTDKLIHDLVKVNNVYRITYEGKKQLSGRRSMNMYKFEDITAYMPSTPAKSRKSK